MAKKAEAWKEYGSAAMVDMMLETLPKVKLVNTLVVTILLTFKVNFLV